MLVGTSLDQMLREEVRPRDADSVDAAVHREHRPGRRLRLRLLVRLHRHHQLGLADRAAADDPRSARGLRSAVRRRRHRGRAGQPTASADKSILDFITAEVARLRQDLGPTDRARLSEYLDDVREIERRIQRVEASNSSGEPRELPGAPVGVPDAFAEHVRLMFDLQAVAFAADITRVFSFKMGRDGSSRVYPESGTNAGFHPPRTTRTARIRIARVREDQHVPHRPAAVLPRQAEEHARRRRQPARQHAW